MYTPREMSMSEPWAQICVQHWGRCSDDLCSGLGVLAPCAGGRCGRRSPPPTTEVQDIYIRNHAMAIGSKGYSDFNTEKRDTIRQNIGADIRSVVPQPNYWEDMSLVPRFQRLSSEPRAMRDTRRVDMFMMRCPCPCRIQENKQKKQHFAVRSH